jgi:flagellar biosynthesis/type III secretory pathway protein FliH
MMTWSSDWTVPSPAAASSVDSANAWSPEELALGGGATAAVDPAVRREAERVAAERRAARERQAQLEEAYQRGFEDGHGEAAAKEHERVTHAVAALQAALATLKAGERAWLENARENIAALAIAVARHVIGREMKGDVHIVAELARRALAHFPVDEPLRVRVNPQDLSVLTVASTAEGGNIPVGPGRDLEWIADADVLPGGCVVEGRHRVVDGRVDHVLERIYTKLADA